MIGGGRRQRRGARCAAVGHVLVVAVLAAPQQAAAALPPVVGARAQAVSGGGGFADAPILRLGTFTDTLLPRETLFYAVRLRPGQRLKIRATVDLRPGSKYVQGIPDALGGFALSLYTPLRQRLARDDYGATTGSDDLLTDADALDVPRVLSFTQAARRATAGEDWIGPGVYHLTAVISQIYRDVGAIVEFPLRLQIEIDEPAGGAGAARTAGPLDAPGHGAQMAAGARRSPPATARGRPSVLKVVIAGGGGLLLATLIAGATVAVLRQWTALSARAP